MTTALPEVERPAAEPGRGDRVLGVEHLSVEFPIGRRRRGGPPEVVHAVEDVSFDVFRGETLGVVGESGSGKTTMGRAVMRLVDATAGRIEFKGADITHVRGEELRQLRRHMQMVYQDPYGSLNPRMTIGQIVSEPLHVHKDLRSPAEARDRVAELLQLVGLPADAARRNPHSFSGGQRQRIGIARALALEPELIVADEPVSALDVSVRAQVVNLLQELQERLGLAYLFVAHDLSIVRHISHRIAIMYSGKLVEVGDREAIYENPRHPYTEALLSAVPIPDPPVQRARRRIVLDGEIPNPVSPPAGCRFSTRCPMVQERCRHEAPVLQEGSRGHFAACHFR